MPISRFRAVLTALLLVLTIHPVWADEIFKTDEERARFFQSLSVRKGPLRVSIPDAFAEFDLPKNMLIVTGNDARRAVHAFEGIDYPDVVAFLLSDSFAITFSYSAVGYCRLDDWSSFDPEAMMRVLLKNSRASNEERKRAGLNELTPPQWEVTPRLNRELALVYWATSFKDGAQETVNISANRFNRYGILGMSFATSKEIYERNPGIIAVFENNLRFQPGARYEDYRPGDKVAPKTVAAMMTTPE